MKSEKTLIEETKDIVVRGKYYIGIKGLNVATMYHEKRINPSKGIVRPSIRPYKTLKIDE